MKSLLRIASLAFSVPSVGPLLGACSSSSSATTSGPSDATVCTAYKEYITSCPATSTSATPACVQAEVALVDSDCSAFASLFSVAFKNAMVTCAPSTTCPFNDPFITTCFESSVTRSPLSAAESKLATDYCAVCTGSTALSGTTTAGCVANFWGLSGDASVPGPGGLALSDSDAIVSQIDTTCLPVGSDAGLSACTNFANCIQNAALAAVPATPAACTTASVSNGGDAGAVDGG